MLNLKEKVNSIRKSIDYNKRALGLVGKIAPHLVSLEIMSAIIRAILPFFEIVFSAKIINELVGEKNLSVLIQLVLVLIVTTFVLGILNDWIVKKINVKKEIFAESHEIFMNNYSYDMDFEKIENENTTELRDRIEGIMDTENGGLKVVSSYIAELCCNVISLGIAFVMCFNMLFSFEETKNNYSWITSQWFSIQLLAVIGLFIIVTAILMKKQKKKMFEATMEGTKYNRYIGYYLWEYLDDNMYAKDIRIFDQSEIVSREMEEKGFNAWVGIFKNCEKLEKKYSGSNSFISAILGGIVYCFVALRSFAGVINIGDVVKYYGAITRFIGAISGVVTTITSINNNVLYLELVFEYIDGGKEEIKGTKKLEIGDKDNYEFVFHDVSFKYRGTGEYALKNLSLKISANERLAIVGMNGSGKTTMIKLLCRFYKPDSGYITLNGVDINELDYEWYKKMFSVVFQDFRLFGFSLGENISANKKYDSKKVWDVLEKTGIKRRVEQLESKLDNYLYKQFDDTGVEISGGEEQKIAISRALYRDSKVYILDEPTAALDPESEYEIYSKMDELTKGNTVIFISHRLSSCYYSDKIAVFNDGEMVQNGTHNELLEDTNGKYYELWNAQAKHYETDEAEVS